MKPDCLNERDLILMYYGEPPEGMTTAAATAHVAVCPACRAGLEQLAADLSRIPVSTDIDPAAATRLAARVSERLSQRHRWLPFAGAAVAGAAALVMAIIVWMPGDQQPPAGHQLLVTNHQQPLAGIEQSSVGPPRPAPSEATLDLELLEQLDLLEELDTLQALEGV